MSMKACVQEAPDLGASHEIQFASMVSQTANADIRFRGEEVLRFGVGYFVIN